MSEVLDLIKMMAEGGFTWQETIILSLPIIGVTLSILIIVRGGVSLVGKVMETIIIALQRIKIRSTPKE